MVAEPAIKRPRAFRLDPVAPVVAVQDVVVTDTPDPFAQSETDDAPRLGTGRWRISIAGVFGAALSLFLSLAIGNWGVRFVEDMIATSPVLGWIAAGLGGVALLALLALGAREWWAVRGLNRVAALRIEAARAFAADDRTRARSVVSALQQHFSGDAVLTSARNEMAIHAAALIDGSDLLKIAERVLLRDCDSAAQRLIAVAARRVSVVTAVSPRAWVDILFVLAQSVRLIRQISEIYGGRPGGFGAVRLFRRVIGHLALTGGVAMTDSVLSQVVGAGLAARLSAKLGEGILNGVLTARVGLAAIDVCRPLPYLGASPPKLSEIARALMRGDADKG